jgi:hypothetical protein
MTGPELEVFATEINGGVTISETLLFQYINIAKAMVEQMRPWMILRKTDTSKNVAAANTWQTAIDLSGMTDFNRFYETETRPPIKSSMEITASSNTARFLGMNAFTTKTFPIPSFLMRPASSSTSMALSLSPVRSTSTTSKTALISPTTIALLGCFPHGRIRCLDSTRSLSTKAAWILTTSMPANRAQAQQEINMLSSWDNTKQQSALTNIDPYNSPADGFRSGSINMN